MPDHQPVPSKLILTASAEDTDIRLDKVVAAALPGLSRTEVQRLIKAGDVLVNGVVEKASYRLSEGESIAVNVPAPEPQTVDPEAIPLDIIFEDSDLAAINKPAGMVVHPAYGNRTGTLVNALLHRWPAIRGVGPEERSGIVHRLDMDTSGVIVVAKTADALTHLQDQFKARTVFKRYIALVEGIPETPSGIIEAPIARDPKRRKRMAVVKGGKPASSRFDVLETFIDNTLLSVEPTTGRTHQIRVHLAWLGHPIVGDDVYGYRKQRIKMSRVFLHAADLHLDSPSTGQRLEFHAPLLTHLEDILSKLRRNQPDAWTE